MSEIGYSGRAFQVLLDEVVIAAINSKTLTMGKESVDVTTDDSDGYRILLPTAGVRSIDTSIEGVATTDNFQVLLAAWQGSEHLTVTLRAPDLSTITAEYGFFFGSLEFSGESAGHVAFSATLQSSGPITVTPAPAP